MNSNSSESSKELNLETLQQLQEYHEAPLAFLVDQDVDKMSAEELDLYIQRIKELTQSAQTRTAKIKKGAKITEQGQKVLSLLREPEEGQTK